MFLLEGVCVFHKTSIMLYYNKILKRSAQLGVLLSGSPDLSTALPVVTSFLRAMIQQEVEELLKEADFLELDFEELCSFLEDNTPGLVRVASGVSASAQGYTKCFLRVSLSKPVWVEGGVFMRVSFFPEPRLACLN